MSAPALTTFAPRAEVERAVGGNGWIILVRVAVTGRPRFLGSAPIAVRHLVHHPNIEFAKAFGDMSGLTGRLEMKNICLPSRVDEFISVRVLTGERRDLRRAPLAV